MMTIFDEWILPEPDVAVSDSIPINSKLLCSIFRRRGVSDAESFRRFTAPTIDDLHDPSTIHGMSSACERIERAVAEKQGIIIYGDYDVDGVTSIVLLTTVLRTLGASVHFVVPHRLVDGYGLKLEVLERVLTDRNVRLVITVDCGITSVEPVKHAIDRGIDVIITDHHLPPGVLPAAAAVLNPKQAGCDYPFKELAGAGVAFKLCCELLRRARHTMSIGSLAKIAALGTIADVAPLVDENRTIAKIGLAGLAEPRNPGMRALLASLGLLGRPLRSSDVGFKIGPRINAAGRLASANTAIELFASRSELDAAPLVEQLHGWNAERQRIEKELLKAAEDLIAREEPLPNVLVLAGEEWHKGVLGLCAGKIAQKYNRPTLMISIEGDQCTGSGRSIASIDLHERLDSIRDLFTHFGGHSHACGFSLPAERLNTLRARLRSSLSSVPASTFRKKIEVEGEIGLSELNRRFVEEHEHLQPFGEGNRQPRFLLRSVTVRSSREFAPGCRELVVSDGEQTATLVVWPSCVSLLPLPSDSMLFDLLVEIEPDRFSPRASRMILVDAAIGGNAPIRNESESAAV